MQVLKIFYFTLLLFILCSCDLSSMEVISDASKEVSGDKELYKKIALLGITPVDISNSTVLELQRYLRNNEGDSLRNLLGANKIEFYIDTIYRRFKLDSIVLFQKHNYYVLYDIANRSERMEKMIDSTYRRKTKLIDTNLYLVEE